MLRSEIFAATANIISVLREARIREALSSLSASLRARPEGVDMSDTLASFQTYSLLSASFGPAERAITKIMSIENLSDARWRAKLIGARGSSDDPRSAAYSMSRRVDFLLNQLPTLLSLLKRSTDPDISFLASELSARPEADGRLVLVLPEQTGMLSSPRRAADAIEAITLLYEAVADLFGSAKSDLAIASCDSGSDKIFDFTGLAAVIEKTKDLIVYIWDRTI